MDENTKKLLEDLKKIVSDLHRSAGQLDDILQDIEIVSEGINDPEYMRAYILTHANYRKDAILVRFKDLEKKERSIWEELRKTLKKES